MIKTKCNKCGIEYNQHIERCDEEINDNSCGGEFLQNEIVIDRELQDDIIDYFKERLRNLRIRQNSLSKPFYKEKELFLQSGINFINSIPSK